MMRSDATSRNARVNRYAAESGDACPGPVMLDDVFERGALRPSGHRVGRQRLHEQVAPPRQEIGAGVELYRQQVARGEVLPCAAGGRG